MSERTLPHNLEAERSVLGAILVHNEALDVVSARLGPGDFFRQAHGLIYGAILTLRARMVVPDLITVKEQLLTQGALDAVGGPVYLAGLCDGIPRATNVEYYAGIVREKSVLRNIIDASQAALSEAYSAELPAETVIANAERSFIGISQQAVADTVTFPDVMTREMYGILEQAKSSGGRGLTGLSTGFPTLDAYTRGLQCGNLIVMGGRPGEGKSALEEQIGLHVAATHGPVLYCSMEMSRAEIASRAIAQMAQVDHHRMSLGRLREDEERRAGEPCR